MALSKPMEMLAAATAAGVGGFVATGALYPLDTLKTRLQSGAAALPGGPGTSKLAAVRALYSGLQYKIAESTTSKFFYFYAYTLLAQLVAPRDGSPIGTGTNLAIGYLSEFVHLPVTLPMEVIATKLQTGRAGHGHGGVAQIVRGVFQESGVAGFYKGFRAYFVLCLQPAIQYTVFERVKALYLERFKKASQSLGALEAFVLGAVARSVATLLLFPYIRAKVILQSKKKSAELESGEEKAPAASQDGIVTTLQRVYAEEGPMALYRGLWPELTKGALSSAVMLMIKEKIQMYITLLMIIANSQSS